MQHYDELTFLREMTDEVYKDSTGDWFRLLARCDSRVISWTSMVGVVFRAQCVTCDVISILPLLMNVPRMVGHVSRIQRATCGSIG